MSFIVTLSEHLNIIFSADIIPKTKASYNCIIGFFLQRNKILMERTTMLLHNMTDTGTRINIIVKIYRDMFIHMMTEGVLPCIQTSLRTIKGFLLII
jgi:hypothetical protein